MTLLALIALILIGIFAHSLNRSVLGYCLLSLIISPVFTAIILILLGENKSCRC